MPSTVVSSKLISFIPVGVRMALSGSFLLAISLSIITASTIESITSNSLPSLAAVAFKAFTVLA